MANKDGDSQKRKRGVPSMNESVVVSMRIELSDEDLCFIEQENENIRYFVHDHLTEIINNPLTKIDQICIGSSIKKLEPIE